MANSLWKDSLQSLIDKVLIAALIGLGGYVWTHWIQADATFWENEAKRLQTESELFAKLVPPGQSIVQGSLHGRAVFSLASNGRREADLRLCAVAGKMYVDWCSRGPEASAIKPDEGAYIQYRIIAPGRLAFYEGITFATSQQVRDASPAAQQAVAQTVDENFRRDPVRAKLAKQLAEGTDVGRAVQEATAAVGGSAPAPPASVQQLARALPIRVYVQIDAAAPADKYKAVLEQLKTLPQGNDACAKYIVPPEEHIPSDKMPRKAQIRYFAEGDQIQAIGLKDCLRQLDPPVEAETVRIPLKAPPNQIELWFGRESAS